MFSWVTKDDLRDFAKKDDLKNFATKDDLSKVESKLEKLQNKVQDNKTAIAELGWQISSLERVQYAVQQKWKLASHQFRLICSSVVYYLQGQPAKILLK